MNILSAAPVVFLAVFLFLPPVSGLAFPKQPGARSVGGVVRAPVVVVLFDELPLTSLVALLTIGLAYGGRIQTVTRSSTVREIRSSRPRPASTSDAVVRETPARSATSASVTLRGLTRRPPMAS